MKITHPLIVGIAKGHSEKELRPFILSLKKTGYTGDVCLFVDDLTPETLVFLHAHGVHLQSFPKRYFTQARRFFLRLLPRLLASPDRRSAEIALAPYYLHFIDARWACYLGFLRMTRGLYSHVMFTDVKDVFFQRNPFDFEWKASLCSFYEAPGAFVKNDSYTMGWLRHGYGAQKARALQEKTVVCAGVTFAEIDAAFEFLELMCEHLIRINSRGLVDQGVYNYILHHHLLKSSFLYEFPETPVVHLGMLEPEKLKFDPQGLVVNGSGQVVNVVHQYFPHRKTLSHCLDLVTNPV